MSTNLPANAENENLCLAEPSVGANAAAPVPPQVIVVPAAGRQTVWWVIAILLAIIATALVDRRDNLSLSRGAMAQQVSGQTGLAPMGARGISAFTAQLGPKEYGLFMMDVDTGTVWCYELTRGRDNEVQMQLVAARSFIFDRFLEEFNVAKPTPSEVQLMVRQQRGHAAPAGSEAGGSTAEQPPANPASQPAGTPFAPALPASETPK